MFEKIRAAIAPPLDPPKSDFDLKAEAAIARASGRYADCWRDRTPAEREVAIRAEAILDMIGAADPDDARELTRVCRKYLRSIDDRVPVIVQRAWHMGDGPTEPGSTVWITRKQAIQLRGLGWVEPG